MKLQDRPPFRPSSLVLHSSAFRSLPSLLQKDNCEINQHLEAVMSTIAATTSPLTAAQLDQLSVNTIRTLSIDAVQQAKS